jgi:hypothetical protein
MKRVLTIMATALLASTLLASAAEARGGGGGGGHMGGFGGGVHMGGGFGGGMGHMGGGMGFRDHAMHHFGPGYFDDGLGCAYPDEAPKAPPWPPYCG